MMQSKTEKRHLKWALIGSLAAVVVLLCLTFAASGATAILLRKVNANDNAGDLVNEETGKTAATRPCNDLIAADVNPNFTERMRMRRLEEMLEESDKRFLRFLEETPVSTGTSAAAVLMLWERKMGGTLTNLEVITANGDVGDVNVAHLAQNPMSRISEGDNCICSPVSLIGNAVDKFDLKCPKGNVGFCSAFHRPSSK
jgi:hypothetical protein